MKVFNQKRGGLKEEAAGKEKPAQLENEKLELEKKIRELSGKRKKTHSLFSEEKQLQKSGERKEHHCLIKESREQLLHLGRYEKEEWLKAKEQKAFVENKISQTRREQRTVNFVRISLAGILLLMVCLSVYFVYLMGGAITGAVTARPQGGDVNLTVQYCTEENGASNPAVYGQPCAGTYPSSCGAFGDRLSCDDGITEEQSTISPFGGAAMKINVSNSTITNCVSIDQVELCYERWVDNNANPLSCLVTANPSGGSSVIVNTTCPGTTPNPGKICTNITNPAVWTCGTFFGSLAKGGEATVLYASTVGGENLNTDVLFYNITYSSQGEVCGTLTVDATMTKNLSNNGNCFSIGASHITLNCAGHEINYSSNGGSFTGITNSNGYDNVTIKNCVLKEGAGNGTLSTSIWFEGGSNDATFYNNTIIQTGSGSHGIIVQSGSNNTNITGNSITLSGANSYGIKIVESSHYRVQANFITNSGSGGGGTTLSIGFNNTFLGDNITITGTGQGIVIGISGGNTYNNTFLNTTIYAVSNFTLMDLSDSAKENILSYYGPFGEINWTSGNLTTNLSLLIGTTIFLENRTLGVIDDTTDMLNLNKTANITMKGLPYSSTPWLLKAGQRCDNTGACNISFDSTNGVLTARVGSFSNYTTNALPTVDTVVLNSTDITKNGTNQNITLYFNSTDWDGDPVKNITNWLRNGTSIMVLNMPFEGINGTSTNNAWDYSRFGYNASEMGGVIWNSTGGYGGGGAYEFNGSTNYLERDIPQLVSGYPFTLSAWVRTNASSTQTIISIASKDVADIMYTMGVTSVGGIGISAYNGAASQDGGFSSGYNDGRWHHFVAVFGSANSRVGYIDGSSAGSQTTEITYNETLNRFSIGRRGDSTPDSYFNGTIDEIKVFNRSLSAQQIVALFNNRTDLLVSQEINSGENWTADVTPNDGKGDGAPARSNQLIVLGITANTRPTAPLAVNPLNGSSLTNRTPPLIWMNSTDADGDIFSYHVQVDDNPLFLNPEINVSSIAPDTGKPNTTHNPTAILNVDTIYFWRVRANDSSGYGVWSNNDALNTSNFTVDSYLAISFVTDLINFGSLSPGQTENTTDNTPAPFNAENAGNIFFNASINGSILFESTSLNNSNYQFRMRESEAGAFDVSQSSMSWKNVSKDLYGLFHLVELNWRDASDNFIVDLNITVPDDEPPGAKASNITFTITGSSVS